uniref:DUF4203 domain-containing protein n=1 Tax=Fervidobacterium nodosum TaxID=2424 RepID=A0A7C5U3D0_9BACT
MINLNTLDLSYVESLVNYFVSNWYIMLPIAVFFYLFPNLVESVSIFAFGVVIGGGYVSPLITSWLTSLKLEILSSVRPELVNIIIAVLCGVIFYGIYKAAIFMGSFVISFFASLFLLRTFFGSGLEWYITLVIGSIIGIIAGSFASKNSSKFIGLFAIIFGSFVISAVGIALFRTYVYPLANVVYLWVILILFLVLLFSRIKILWGNSK